MVMFFVELKDMCIFFGGVWVVDYVFVDFYFGEVVGLFGYNGVGKFILIKILLGVYKGDSGEIWINGEEVYIYLLRDVWVYNIEIIYQMFVFVDNLDVVLNFFLG